MSSLPTHERQMAATGPAYLVIRNGSRWTDVYRLEPEKPVIIGRASNCQIVIADDRCSRKHAEIFYRGGHWLVRDLGSRNGTAVDQQTIGGEHALQVGQSVVVAGCQMVYVKDVAQAFSSGMALPGDSDSDHDRDPQRTEDEHSPALITHRQHRADLLADGQGAPDRAAAIARLAFQLAQSADLSDAAGHALDIALARTGARQGAVLAIPEELRSKSDSLTTPPTVSVAHLHVLAAKHDSGRSYHRLPDLIASTVCGGGEAVLARNLRNDESLVRQDSRGQLNTSSTLAAPIRSGNQILGLIHLYSNLHESDLQPDHLEFVWRWRICWVRPGTPWAVKPN